MQEMKIRCTSQEHAGSVVGAAIKSGYRVNCLQIDIPDHNTLFLHENERAGFWPWRTKRLEHYPEYALYGDHLLPVSEGWIENKGECPVAVGTKIDVLYRDGDIARGVTAGTGAAVTSDRGIKRCARSWGNAGIFGDIIAYRLADRQQPAEDKAEPTPCQKRGLRVGQWVWRCKDNHILSRGWVKLCRYEREYAWLPSFYDPRRDSERCGELQYIDFTQGIHDSKPDWTPGEQTPVEWDGRDVPVVGERVVISSHATGGKEVSGVIVLPPDSDGDYVIKSDDGVYWTECANSLRPIQSERDKAVNDLECLIVKAGMIVDFSARVAHAIYDAGYRKTENSNDG